MLRILVIDDDAALRAFLRDALAGAGYEVIEAADGVEGIGKYRVQRPDLVITDLFMPNKEGLETIRELRAEFPKAPIIAICGRPHAGPMLGVALQMGAATFLHKPFSSQELLVAIEKALHSVGRTVPTKG